MKQATTITALLPESTWCAGYLDYHAGYGARWSCANSVRDESTNNTSDGLVKAKPKAEFHSMGQYHDLAIRKKNEFSIIIY